MTSIEAEKRCNMIINAIYKVKAHAPQKKYYRYKVKVDDNYILYRTNTEWIIYDIKTKERHAIKVNGHNELGRLIQLYFAQYNAEKEN